MNLSLHSNMFLLILKAQMMWCEIEHLFTFQYVSINTQPTRQNRLANYTLHSNMFLLIPGCCIPCPVRLVTFTFQYVSINTVTDGRLPTHRFSLHSNMFLLIPHERYLCTSKTELYIPICFY